MNTFLLGLLMACGGAEAGPGGKVSVPADVPVQAAPIQAGQAEAIFASGCFWCAEKDFEALAGVIAVESGYAGGKQARPTYMEVGTGRTGHTEAIRVVYDPKQVTYEALLDHFWHHVDPFDPDGQFCDQGSQYRPAIFPLDEAQRVAADASKVAIAAKLGKPVVVKLEVPGTFWVAESYHQDFHVTNPIRYQTYRYGCGRDARIAEIWAGVPGPADLGPAGGSH